METYEDYYNSLTPEEQAAEDAYMRAEHEAEMRGELMADWIFSGGDPADASRYAHYEMNGWPTLINPDEGTCEHGLSASLCAGPSHYPLDM
jgi:hypothetical protein